MSITVPAKLKSADITRFAQRAAQLETVKPAIAYWCNYWIVQQVLGKGLHNQDDECKLYTTQLMDKLEELKAQHPNDDAITDDMVGQAYIEQFGSETFQRADNAMNANKASRQTADTFQASATFLDLVHIWGPPSPEIASKIKYAKFHALRIAKALKAGEDPNAGNPTPAQTPTEEGVPLDPQDPEVQQFMEVGHKARVEDAPDDTDRLRRASASQSLLDQSLHPSRDASIHRKLPQQAKVEDASDEQHKFQAAAAARSIYDQSLHPSRAPSVPPPGTGPEISPMVPDQSADQDSCQGSTGVEYFPNVELPTVPQGVDASISHQQQPGPVSPTGYISPTSAVPPAHPKSYYTQPGATSIASNSLPPTQPRYPTPQPQPPPHTNQRPPMPPQAQSRQPQSQGPPIHTPAPIPNDVQQYATEEEAILAAQKHAKWAISALNFEDVPTAIKELRLALQTLGAQ